MCRSRKCRRAAPVQARSCTADGAAYRTEISVRARRGESEEEQIPDLTAFEEAEQDERAARIAVREAKAAARQEKAAAKAAARQAKREAKLAAKQAAEAEEEFDDIPDLPEEDISEEMASSKHAGRGVQMTRKEARAARIAAEQAEEEEEIQLRDPAQAQRAFKRRAQGLSARFDRRADPCDCCGISQSCAQH